MPLFARRYDVQTVLGQGGNGVVWRAHDLNQAQDVALKFFRPGFPPGLVFNEAQQLTALGGPHVLRVLNADIYNDIPYIATEIAAAGSAMDRIQSTLGVSLELAIRWTRHLLSGLDACHRASLLHRDVKPGNLFLQSDDVAQLGDFGHAERMHGGTVPAAGTTAFFPPETLTTGQMTVRADVYAAGLTLWMLLTGRHPFGHATDPADLSQLIQTGVPRIRDGAPCVPSRVAKIVETACSAAPGSRYATAQAMHEALGALPAFARQWIEVAPAAGELRRWESTAKPSELHGYAVVVRPDGQRFEIETRRNGGANHLVHSHCHRQVPGRLLATRLRATFDGLA